jgi:hypothetical protein
MRKFDQVFKPLIDPVYTTIVPAILEDPRGAYIFDNGIIPASLVFIDKPNPSGSRGFVFQIADLSIVLPNLKTRPPAT